MEEKPGIAEQLLDAIRDGIDAARYFARHEAFGAMANDDADLLELAHQVESCSTDLDEAMMRLLEHQEALLDEPDQAN